MSTPYGITINMDQNTVTTLLANGYSLYAFKAVQGPTTGAPLVWFQTQQFALNTALSWQEQYQAYSSTTAINSGVTITASSTYDVDLGDEFTINGASGTGTITTNGSSPIGIEIYNDTTTEFTAGISQVTPSGLSNPMCAFPLFGQMDDIIVPIEQVMLMFATNPFNTGSVIMTSFSQGIMIDLTSVNQRSVSYVLNTGWSTGGQTGMTIYPPKTAMQPLLVQSSATTVKLSMMLAERR